MPDGNPFAPTFMNPNVSKTSLWDLRMMSAANRMETPFMRGSHTYRHPMAQGTMLGNLGQMSEEPDYSRFTTDPMANAQARQALSPYGLAPLEANQVKQNMILPNSGFFKGHPRLSAALEGGMFGAMAAHGGETAGESIQGALEGMIGGQRLKQGLYNQQFARPFEAAGMIEGLQDAQQRRQLQEADIQHLRAMNEHLERGDDLKFQQLQESNRTHEALEALNNERLNATAPRNLGGGLYGYYDPSLAKSGGSPWKIQENYDAKLGRAAAGAAGAGPWYTTTDAKGKKVFGRVHEGQQVPEGANFIQGTYEQKRGDKAGDARQKWIAAQSGKPGPVWMMAGIQPGDPKATEKLGKFYDSQIAPLVPQQEQAAPGGFTQNPDGSFSQN